MKLETLSRLRAAAMDQSNPYRAFHMSAYVVLMESFRDMRENSIIPIHWREK